MYARLLPLMLLATVCPPMTLAAETKSTKDLSDKVFGLDRVWSIHLIIQPKDWEKMQPTNRGGPFGGFGFGRPAEKEKAKPAKKDPDREPRGLFGLDFAYVKGVLEMDGKTYKDVGVRFKGSGTWISSQGRLKRPFKIDFNRYDEDQTFMGLKGLTLNNNAMEPTGVREVLAYGVFRSLDVPAPRTAYAAVTLTVPGKYNKEFLGLYVLAESVDKTFLKRHFGSSKGLLLKPERVGAMEYLGEDWAAYEPRYQPKTNVKKKAQQRLIEFTRLIQKADDKTFAREIGNYLDVDEFLRFLAANVALSSMDSFIGMGRNFYFYLHPETNKFVFIPWDVDLALGAFLVLGTPEGLMDLSIRQPCGQRNRLVERLLADRKVYAIYEGHLKTAITRALTVEGVKKDLRAIHKVIDPIQERERKASAARGERGGWDFGGMVSRAPKPETFAEKRVASIKAQLAGERKGTLARSGFGQPPAGGFGRPPAGGFGPGLFLAKPVLTAADKDKDGKMSKEETTEAIKVLFKALDAEKKGELDQKAVSAGLDRVMPGPRFPGGRRPGGFPTLGERLGRVAVEKAGKDGKVSEAALVTAAGKLFVEADENKDGKLDDKELTAGLNKLIPAPKFGPPGGNPFGVPNKKQ